LDAVAELLKARRRRRLSPEQRAVAAARLGRTRLSPLREPVFGPATPRTGAGTSFPSTPVADASGGMTGGRADDNPTDR
jgi:hypothetical protein